MRTEWNTFKGGVWQREINVRDFIQKNYTPYDGNDQFLEGPTENTTELWDQVMELSKRSWKRAVSWIWIQKLYPPSLPTVPAI